jgi:hypothetical protein
MRDKKKKINSVYATIDSYYRYIVTDSIFATGLKQCFGYKTIFTYIAGT